MTGQDVKFLLRETLRNPQAAARRIIALDLPPQVGWLGLGLFVAIFAVVMVRLWRLRQDWKALAVFASGLGLAVIGLLLPVWVDDTVAMIWWGLAAVVLAEGGVRGKSTNQKAKRTT